MDHFSARLYVRFLAEAASGLWREDGGSCLGRPWWPSNIWGIQESKERQDKSACFVRLHVGVCANPSW